MEATLTCTPNQAKENIIRCIKAGLVPFIQSSPGVGKSSIVKQIAKEFNLKLIDHRLSTSDPTDMLGLPHFENGQATFAPFRELFPLHISGMNPEEEKKLLFGDKDGALLFLDEFNSAPRSVQAAAYRLILDREVGQHKLHRNVAIVCAGNKLDDNAITVNLSTAMQSRLIHIIMEPNLEQWMENVAIKEHYDERVTAYLKMFPEHLMVFNPENVEHTFACPRTWEFVNRLIKNEPEIDNSYLALLSGTITNEIAISFLSFCKVKNEMITYKDVIAHPETAKIPEKNEAKWGTIFHLLNHVDGNNFEEISKYIGRYSVDYKIIFYRSVYKYHPELEDHPAFTAVKMELAKFF